MPRILPNTTTTDQYPGTAGGAQIGIGDIFGSGFFVVANAAVFAQYFHGLRGQADNSDELFLPPGTYPLSATDKDPLGGIRFRSAVKGVPAQVFGVLYYPNEATLLASSEFTAQVGSSGTISAGGGVLTGIIAAAGTVPIAGTGFTVTHVNGSGVYNIIYTTPFASPPLVLCQMNDFFAAAVCGVTNNLATGFTASWSPAADHQFMFESLPIS